MVILASHLCEKTGPEMRMAGIATLGEDGVERNMHRDAVPSPRATAQPGGISRARECPEAAEDLYDYQ